MKNYELMTPDEIEALPKVYTTIQFSIEQPTKCLKLFTEDFSFSKVIPIPENYQIVHGPVIEKALATFFTNLGRNEIHPAMSNIVNEMLQYAGIAIPDDFHVWFRKCTKYCDAETFQRFHALGQQYYENYKLTKTFTSAGFCSKFWGTPSDVVECLFHVSKSTAGFVLTTLAKPPLPWLIVLSEMYPALSFIATIEDNSTIITYRLNCGSLEKVHEEPAKTSLEDTTLESAYNSHKLDTMGIFS